MAICRPSIREVCWNESVQLLYGKSGKIGGSGWKGNTLFVDLFDEIFAYIMENAYSGYKTLSSINPDYVRNITYGGKKLYEALPFISVNTHSSILSYDLAYRTHYWGGYKDKRSVAETFNGVYAK